MRKGKYRNIGMRDAVGDIISEALPYNIDEEKRLADTFTNSREYSNMLDDIVNEVNRHIEYNFNKFSEEVTK